MPSESPTPTPSAVPTATPTVAPTSTPTAAPSATPTSTHTAVPTSTATGIAPTATPAVTPTAQPSATPTQGTLATEFNATAQTINAAPGAQVTMTFTATNGTGAPETINSITIGLGNPALFSALGVSAGGQSGVASGQLGTSNQFTFSPVLSLAKGGALTFTVTGTLAGGMAMTGPPARFALATLTGMFDPTQRSPRAAAGAGFSAAASCVYASLIPAGSDMFQELVALLAGFGLLGLAMLGWRGDLRLPAFAAGLVLCGMLIAVASGCGSSNSSPPPPRSTVSVTAAQASGADGTTAGLPLQIAVVVRK
jgi:hypothetical protein